MTIHGNEGREIMAASVLIDDNGRHPWGRGGLANSLAVALISNDWHESGSDWRRLALIASPPTLADSLADWRTGVDGRTFCAKLLVIESGQNA